MKIHKSIKTILTLAGASLVCSATLQAATLIVNGDFEDGDADNTPFDGPGWSASTLTHESDDDLGTGSYVYSWGSRQSTDQDIIAAWTTADTIDISLITAIASWGNGSGDVLVELRRASDDFVLWSSTAASTSTAVTHDWSIDASTLAATAGENLNLKLSVLGNGNIIDDVSLELNAVPEPSTTALLGLGGLALILRRRK